MKTLNLFDNQTMSAIKTHPTRKEAIEAFKKANCIWTYHTDGMTKLEEPWIALLTHKARVQWEEPNMDEFELIANYCCALDGQHLLTTGETEAKAIKKLCKLNNITCDL